ncbi:NAD(P)-dependent alcohol dehydrogenase [Nocardia sp. NPDC059246]|uniref:NAD(P)-dependent alcohol dehydrogenase n=1 Tax=Nocardia sp. NPDC059246 TaxID=3346789 RepID=UPI00369ECB40
MSIYVACALVSDPRIRWRSLWIPQTQRSRFMRAVQLTAPGRIAIQQVPIPELGHRDVLVRVAGAGLCHSDLHVLRHPRYALPMTLGHEVAGYVESTGPDVSEFAGGEDVLVYLVWSCGTCRPCREGRENVCAAQKRGAVPPAPGLGPDGGMAEYIKVDVRYLERLGGVSPLLAAPLADAGLTSYHAIDDVRHLLTSGSSAVVIGVGGLGHVGLQILRAVTGARIIAVDNSQPQLDLARALGADAALNNSQDVARAVLEFTDGYGADAVFDFVGLQATVDLACRVVAPGGAIRLIGLAGGTLSYETAGVTVPWGVDVKRSYAGTRADLRNVIELARQEKIRIETRTYKLDDAQTAFDDLARGSIVGRAVLVP